MSPKIAMPVLFFTFGWNCVNFKKRNGILEMSLLYYLIIFITLFILLTYYFFSKIGEEQLPEDAEDGPPELLVNWHILHT